jgi:Ribbon-helix-helix protein, copG family
MTNDTRFEVKLPAARRAALDSLADEAGVSASDLVRLAITQLLRDRDVRLPSADRTEAA